MGYRHIARARTARTFEAARVRQLGGRQGWIRFNASFTAKPSANRGSLSRVYPLTFALIIVSSFVRSCTTTLTRAFRERGASSPSLDSVLLDSSRQSARRILKPPPQRRPVARSRDWSVASRRCDNGFSDAAGNDRGSLVARAARHSVSLRILECSTGTLVSAQSRGTTAGDKRDLRPRRVSFNSGVQVFLSHLHLGRRRESRCDSDRRRAAIFGEFLSAIPSPSEAIAVLVPIFVQGREAPRADRILIRFDSRRRRGCQTFGRKVFRKDSPATRGGYPRIDINSSGGSDFDVTLVPPPYVTRDVAFRLPPAGR